MQAVDPALGTLTQSSSTGNVCPIMFIPTKWWLSLGYTYCYVIVKVRGRTLIGVTSAHEAPLQKNTM